MDRLFLFYKEECMFFEKSGWKDERKYDKIGKMGGVCPDEDFCFISPECSAENEFCTDGNFVSEFRRRVIEGEIKL